eukprot:TRINITY_DN2204_c5_g1_i2.p1 TRINITY_DN2204_c5_g1~~TRINITY_DN2204_c5_g1_i2.p1  ORF type:complete len:233 (+),score=41.98 TRINITY_DN2204_c5_g1_i2:34-699(+)
MGAVMDMVKKDIPTCGGDVRSTSLSVVVVGLDGAGKTKMCLDAMGREEEAVVPTGMEDVVFVNKQAKERMNEWMLWGDEEQCCRVVDIGGKKRHRALWTQRFKGKCGIMYVIDTHDKLRFEESCACLHELVLPHVFSAQIPALIVFNDKGNLAPTATTELIDTFSLKDVLHCGKIKICRTEDEATKTDAPGAAFRKLVEESTTNLATLMERRGSVKRNQRG